MNARAPVSARSRFEIFKRDKFTCQYCGQKPPQVVLHVDHIIPVAGGGSNDHSNLVTACAGCNMGKSAVPLTSVPASLEEQALEAQERRLQVEAHAEMLQAEREAFEQWCWNVAEILQPGSSDGWSREKFTSVKMFVERLGCVKTLDAAQISADRWHPGTRRFKYFCGICWRKLQDAEEGQF